MLIDVYPPAPLLQATVLVMFPREKKRQNSKTQYKLIENLRVMEWSAAQDQ